MPVASFVPSRIHIDYPEWQTPVVGDIGKVWAYTGSGYAPASFLAASAVSAFGLTLIDDADASAARTTLGLGTAATLNVGTSANNIVQLDGTGKLPAVDGSQLTGISGGSPGGSTTQVQYNNAGSFAGDAGMTYDAANDALTVAGRVVTPVWRPASDSTTALQLQNAAGTAVVTVNTVSKLLEISSATVANVFATSIFSISVSGTRLINFSADDTLTYFSMTRPAGASFTYQLRDSNCQITSTKSIVFESQAVGTSLQFKSNGQSTFIVTESGFRAETRVATAQMRVIGLSTQTSDPFTVERGSATVIFFVDAFGITNIKPVSSATNTVTDALLLRHNTSGTPAAGFGLGIAAKLESSTTEDQDAGRLTYEWVTATHATRASRGKLTAYYTTTEQEAMRWDGDTGGLKLGFYGVTPVARQLLATGASATVDDVIQVLQNLGLVKQS